MIRQQANHFREEGGGPGCRGAKQPVSDLSGRPVAPGGPGCPGYNRKDPQPELCGSGRASTIGTLFLSFYRKVKPISPISALVSKNPDQGPPTCMFPLFHFQV